MQPEKSVANNITPLVTFGNIDRIASVMQRFPHGISRKKVAEILNVKVSTITKAWSKARHNGLIKKVGYGTFVLTSEKQKSVTDFSLGTTIYLHALQLSFPIIEDHSQPENFDSINDMANWKGYIKRFEGFTIKKNVKTVQAWAWAKKLKGPEEIEQLAHSMVFHVATKLWKIGVMVDVDHVRTVTKHVALKKSELEQIFPKGTSVSVDLGRNVVTLFEDDRPEPARAWTDSSPFRCIETNDVDYARKVLLMPELMTKIVEHQAIFSENLMKHLSVLDKMSETLDKIQQNLGELNQK